MAALLHEEGHDQQKQGHHEKNGQVDRHRLRPLVGDLGGQTVDLTLLFLLGLGGLPILGWTGGTLLGALAGSVLPLGIRTALGVMLYGMFIAIVVPPAKKEKEILITVLLAMALSTLFTLVPLLKQVSAGIAIVICTVVAAAVGAVLFPIPEEEEVNA
jgi:predicted branched-subunit amino acid permease